MTEYPNILFISGSGRKGGKTYLACEIIKRLSGSFPVMAIKITPHKHGNNHLRQVVHSSDKMFIALENFQSNGKDSSRMLNAGADKVYFIQAEDSEIPNALELIQLNKNEPVICETGGAGRFITPGLQIFLDSGQNDNELKNRDIKYKSDLIIRMKEERFDFDVDRITYHDKTWKINNL
jgi:hypothetical protein